MDASTRGKTTNNDSPTATASANQEKALSAAKSLQNAFDGTTLHLRANADDFHATQFDADDVGELKDPAVLASQVAEQASFLRKLKVQYLHQNTKDKYVKSIVSDIENAPIVTRDDNQKLDQANVEQKQRLHKAKEELREVQGNVKTLAPMVEEDFAQFKQNVELASSLSQKIIDTRLDLTRLQQTHPHPRYTIATAEEKLNNQVDDIQALYSEADELKDQLKALKDKLAKESVELERLRGERADIEKAVRTAKVDEDDARLVPLYQWYTAALSLHRSLVSLEESHSETTNELRLVYRLPSPGAPHRVIFILIFAPDTRRLMDVRIEGVAELDVKADEQVEFYMRTDDVPGLVGAVLASARAAIALE